MTASDRFVKLCSDLLNGTINENNIEVQTLIDNISDYVHEIEHTYEGKKILAAPDMINVRVYHYEPGTGQATKQFRKFAKAMTYHPMTFRSRLTTHIILSMLKNYLEDEME